MAETKADDLSDLASKSPSWCVVPANLPGRMRGNKGSEEFDGNDLAVAAWGEAAKGKDSGLISMAYLWRRFGPSPWGSDSHKELCSYIIGTPMEGVFLTLGPSGSPLEYAVGYISTIAVQEAMGEATRAWFEQVERWTKERGYADPFDIWSDKGKKARADRDAMIAEIGPRPHPDMGNWRELPGPVGDLNRAVHAAMRELLRPVWIRDVAINILGRCDPLIDEDDEEDDRQAEESKYAGLGIPRKALDQLLAEEAR